MPAELTTARLIIRPTVPQDVTTLLTIRNTPWVNRWWGSGADEPGWPLIDDEVAHWTIWHGTQVAGFVQCYEQVDPSVRYAGLDLFLAEPFSGQGLGREVIQRMVEHLTRDRGHHRIVIDPATDNVRAIACYETCGFRRVGVMTDYERNHDGPGWHDAVLMERVTRP